MEGMQFSLSFRGASAPAASEPGIPGWDDERFGVSGSRSADAVRAPERQFAAAPSSGILPDPRAKHSRRFSGILFE
jgi:hypothetical protein